MRAIVLAGGKGTRLRPLTDTTPKPLLPFMGDPFAVGLVRRLESAGVEEVTFLVGRDPEPWTSLGLKAVPEEAPLDTAGAARRLLAGQGNGPVVVCNGDVLTDLDIAALLAAHTEAGAVATIALTRVEDTSTFGVVVCDDDGRVRRFVEKPAPGTVDADTVNAGTYVIAPSVFNRFPGDGPLSFERDVFPSLVSDDAVVVGHPSEAVWADLGTPERYLAGHRAVLDGRCSWPLAEGMELRDGPVAVHETAEVDPDAVVGPYAVVGARCRIGRNVRITASVLFDDVVVEPNRTISGEIVTPTVVCRADGKPAGQERGGRHTSV